MANFGNANVGFFPHLDNADMLDYLNYAYLFALTPMLLDVLWNRNCVGYSIKTQFLYSVIFTIHDVLRFTKLTTVVVVLTYCTTILIFIFRKPEQAKHDSFRIETLIVPCIVFAIFINHGNAAVQVLSAFSIYLEVITIIPQTYLVSKTNFLSPIVYYYVFVMSIYKFYHLANWMYIYYYYEEMDNIVVASVIVQIIFYADFFITHINFAEEINCETNENEARIENKNDGGNSDNFTMICDQLQEVKYDNLQSIILMPAMLLNNEKIILDPNEAKESSR